MLLGVDIPAKIADNESRSGGETTDRSNDRETGKGYEMTLTEATNQEAEQRIADFNEMIMNGWTVESAKKYMLESTCIKAVIKYINEYK